MSHQSQNPFKWRHFQADIILLCVRWYLRYAREIPRSRRDDVGARAECRSYDHLSAFVQHYAPELDRRCRPHLKAANDSWRVDETYIKVKKQWVYLYRAVDPEGNTLDFFFNSTRDAKAAKQFFLKMLAASHTAEPRVIGRWTKTRPTRKCSMSSRQKGTSLNTANYAKSNTSII